MSLTYTYQVNNLYITNTTGVSSTLLSAFVVQIDFTAIGTDTVSGLSGSYTGSCEFDPLYIDPSTYTQYNSLTQDLVLGWVQNYIAYTPSVSALMDRTINEYINKQLNPVFVIDSVSFPWLSGGN
jgi:hypothetical protein